MRFLFDIAHLADLNFLKYSISRLREEGHEILVAVLKRGCLPQIAKKELPETSILPAGNYGRNLLELVLKTGLARELELARVVSNWKPDLAVGVASFQTGILSKFFGFKNLGIYDDPEAGLYFWLTQRTSHHMIVPECLGLTAPNLTTFRGLKEWAYLSPVRFTPDESAPARYGLKKKEYLFIRDVDTMSLNYRHQRKNNVARLYGMGLRKTSVLLSLENKKWRERYQDWQILEEPVDDIHSLMYYSRAVISNGDSMAREGAQLGVPAIYCGERLMKANQMLADLGFLRHITDPHEIFTMIEDEDMIISDQEQIRRRTHLLNVWDDPNQMVYEHLINLSGHLLGAV